jgi:V/A-type H+-transporting ATPase subunit C
MENPNSEEDLEKALNQHTAEIYGKVTRTVPGEMKDVIKDLLKIYDAKNIKMVFRSIQNGTPIEKRAELIHQIGTLKEHVLKTLVESKTIEEATSELETTEYGKIVSAAMPKVQEQKNLIPLEMAIDKYVYEKAHKKIAISKDKNMVAVTIMFGTKIDILNLKTMLRLRSSGGKIDNIDNFLIDASYGFTQEKLKAIAKAETVDEILSQLEGTPYSDVLSEVSTSFKETGSLYQIEKAIDEYYEKTVKQLSIKYGLGIGPALNMITGKERDAKKIRIAANFSTNKIDPETGGVSA